jgi:hypothetical protein
MFVNEINVLLGERVVIFDDSFNGCSHNR